MQSIDKWKKAKLLIDTGASNSINSTSSDHFELQNMGFSSFRESEGKMEAIMTLNCNIKLGRNYKGKQAFVLLDLSHVNDTLNSQGVEKIDGVIGADFLKENNAIIDYGQSKLFLQLESFKGSPSISNSTGVLMPL